jgi:hypothetical protein
LSSKTLEIKQYSTQLVVILVDFSIPHPFIDINQPETEAEHEKDASMDSFEKHQSLWI